VRVLGRGPWSFLLSFCFFSPPPPAFIHCPMGSLTFSVLRCRLLMFHCLDHVQVQLVGSAGVLLCRLLSSNNFINSLLKFDVPARSQCLLLRAVGLISISKSQFVDIRFERKHRLACFVHCWRSCFVHLRLHVSTVWCACVAELLAYELNVALWSGHRSFSHLTCVLILFGEAGWTINEGMAFVSHPSSALPTPLLVWLAAAWHFWVWRVCAIPTDPTPHHRVFLHWCIFCSASFRLSVRAATQHLVPCIHRVSCGGPTGQLGHWALPGVPTPHLST
jgi:hypothetical protein